jgi:hypothetical protein
LLGRYLRRSALSFSLFIGQAFLYNAIFFFASASAAYLTVSEIFPMETRAIAIAFSYAIGTAVGASPARCCPASASTQPPTLPPLTGQVDRSK